MALGWGAALDASIKYALERQIVRQADCDSRRSNG